MGQLINSQPLAVAYTSFRKFSQFLLDLLYPPCCVNCKTTNEWLCQDCFKRIAFITFPVCERCGASISTDGLPLCVQCKNNPLQSTDGIRSASYYEDNPIRPAIHFLKYRNHRGLASILGKILIEAYRRYNLKADVIVPVPLHPSRLRERGYNQSQLLANEIGIFFNLPVDTDTLQRVRKTKSQMELEVNERRQNVLNAFVCRSKKLAGQKVLLVDDVCTTGSTLDACAAALKEGGAASVWGLTLAKTHFKKP
jgi:ComF family protein